jgi:hypothetical protein
LSQQLQMKSKMRVARKILTRSTARPWPEWLDRAPRLNSKPERVGELAEASDRRQTQTACPDASRRVNWVTQEFDLKIKPGRTKKILNLFPSRLPFPTEADPKSRVIQARPRNVKVSMMVFRRIMMSSQRDWCLM